MKTIWKVALGAVALCMVGGCTPYDGYYDSGYYAAGGGGWGYCDSWGCPDDYWDRPLYYGSIYSGGRWLNGPFYYRDWNGGRQYWLGGGWRNDDWRGARPPQYRDNRTGPAQGREGYRNNRPGFDGDRGGNRTGLERRENDGPRGRNPGRNQAEIQQNQVQPFTPPPDRFGRDRAQPPSPPPPGGERVRGGRARGSQ
jgi:hypothetical protein